MNEFERIIQAYENTDSKEKRTAIATVVKLYGSSYRRPGARMFMTEDGHWTGAISGGCLEGDALRKARKAILDAKPVLVTYDTLNDEDAKGLGVGLGCNGIIDVLIEPLQHNESDLAIEMLKKSLQYKETAIIVTLFRIEGKIQSKVGDRLVRLPDGKIENHIKDEVLKRVLLEDIEDILLEGKSQSKEYKLQNGLVEVFIEVFKPAIQLMIFGGGYDAIPVSELAKNIGWQVTVSDDCPAHLGPKRFPAANAVICIQRDTVSQNIEVTPHTAAVLMSHNYKYDLAVLKELLKTEICYIGLLGPKKRFEKMQDEMAEEGIILNENDLQRIHNPVGLDIGAETPEEIALSMIAEIQAKFTGRPATFLKDKEGFIHERESEVGVAGDEI